MIVYVSLEIGEGYVRRILLVVEATIATLIEGDSSGVVSTF